MKRILEIAQRYVATVHEIHFTNLKELEERHAYYEYAWLVADELAGMRETDVYTDADIANLLMGIATSLEDKHGHPGTYMSVYTFYKQLI